MDVQSRLDDGHEQVVSASGVVVHRVPLLPRPLLGVRRRPLFREVDHLEGGQIDVVGQDGMGRVRCDVMGWETTGYCGDAWLGSGKSNR